MSRKYTDSKWKEIIEKENPEHVEVLKIIRKKGQKTKVKIKCLDHNIVRTICIDNARRYGCSEHQIMVIGKNNRFSYSQWFNLYEKSWYVNNRKHYIFPKQKIINAKTPILWICPVHGKFYACLDEIVRAKSGCGKCGHIRGGKKESIGILKAKQYVNRATNGHYRIVSSTYKNTSTPLMFEWIDEHYFFKMCLKAFKRGQRAPIIHKSKGETILENIFRNSNIEYVSQYSYRTATRLHYFDFYLPTYHLLIEYNGEQHYKEVAYFKRKLIEQKNIDKEKEKIATKTKNKLIWIKYTYNTPQKIIKLLQLYNIDCYYSSTVDYYNRANIITLVAEYYQKHLLKHTCKKFNICASLVKRYYKLYYGYEKNVRKRTPTQKKIIADYYLAHTARATIIHFNEISVHNLSRTAVNLYFKEVYNMTKTQYLKQKELTKKTV